MVKVGYVRRAHGVRGAVVAQPLSDDPDRFDEGAQLATDNPSHPHLVIKTAQSHKDGLLVAFDNIDDRDEADALRGTSLFISADERRELSVDEFWPEQLEGLAVIGTDGQRYGIVIGVVDGDSQSRLQVEGRAGVFEVPFVAALVPTVDLEAKRVIVDLPDGLAL